MSRLDPGQAVRSSSVVISILIAIVISINQIISSLYYLNLLSTIKIEKNSVNRLIWWTNVKRNCLTKTLSCNFFLEVWIWSQYCHMAHFNTTLGARMRWHRQRKRTCPSNYRSQGPRGKSSAATALTQSVLWRRTGTTHETGKTDDPYGHLYRCVRGRGKKRRRRRATKIFPSRLFARAAAALFLFR